MVLVYAVGDRGPRIPEINPLRPFEFTDRRRNGGFVLQSKDLMLKGKAAFGDSPFGMHTESGEVVVLPPAFIQELRSDPRLKFAEPAVDDAHGYVPGFDPFNCNPAISTFIMRYLIKVLAKLAKPISGEATPVLRHVLADSTDWHQIAPRTDITRIAYPASPPEPCSTWRATRSVFQPLREELVRVLGAEGLKITASHHSKLMDSAVKESQRVKPALLSTWRRLVREDIELSSRLRPAQGPKDHQYDGYRFLKMRGTDEEKFT
ncbi:hypothetical protein LY76DRAFT_648738 [Colletotrichum caudatum]|nr:hypothetical protein LY76DRAFT_648738 [Colletotrichum caudatum]